MTEDNFIDQSDKHYEILGRAVHNWADMEHSVFGYLKNFCGAEKAYKELISSEFIKLSTKLNILYCFVDIRMKKNTLTYERDLDDVFKLFKDIKKLNSERNKFIHNPIGYWLDSEEESLVNGLLIGKEIGKDAEFSNYELNNIKVFTDNVESTHNVLKILMSKISRLCYV
jgi:hypothetical protein